MIGKVFAAAAVLSSVATTGAINGSAISMTAAASFPINISLDGGTFNGSGEFRPGGSTARDGAFHFWGNLNDTSGNGREVYLEVAVEGYSPNEFRNAVDTSQYWDQDVWDYQALYTSTARMRVCEAVSFFPDPCSGWASFNR